MITGSCVALITPMKNDETIDYNALGDLIEWHIQEKTDAIVALGTTGESATLTSNEKSDLMKFIITQIRGRLPVIVGTGTNSTKQTIDLTQEAKSQRADACLLVVPYYNKPGQTGLYKHFTAIANNVDIPQILYNVPGRTITDLLPSTVELLMDHPNICGIKDATGDLERAKRLVESSKDKNFYLYSGDDETALEFINQGGHGVISVVANIVPNAFHQMCSFALTGKKEEAQAVYNKLSDLCKALFVEANPIPVKWALNRFNKIPAGIRLPLTEMDNKFTKSVTDAMIKSGINL